MFDSHWAVCATKVLIPGQKFSCRRESFNATLCSLFSKVLQCRSSDEKKMTLDTTTEMACQRCRDTASYSPRALMPPGRLSQSF